MGYVLLVLSAILFVASWLLLVLALPFFLTHSLAQYLYEIAKRQDGEL